MEENDNLENDNLDKENDVVFEHTNNVFERNENKEETDSIVEGNENKEENDIIVKKITLLEKNSTTDKQTNTIIYQTNSIICNLNLLERNISKIKKKIAKVNKLYLQLEKNKILVIDPNSNYLKFQLSVLKNECSYYKNLYTLLLNKYANEIYELSEYIYLILVSLNKLEIEKDEEKTNICNKIIHIKKTPNISYGKLNEIINSAINNLKLINDYVKLFDGYINKTVSNNNFQNVHNNTYEISIKNKKESIILEYNKFYNKFLKIVSYFKECSDGVIDQIDNSKLLKFFLKGKSI